MQSSFMTPEERLDQLEPLLSETTAILDRHTAQLRQHSVLLRQLVQATQSNTQLMEQLREGQTSCQEQLTQLQQAWSQPPTMPATRADYEPGPTHQMAELETRFETMGGQLEALSSKMDLILTKLIRVYINN